MAITLLPLPLLHKHLQHLRFSLRIWELLPWGMLLKKWASFTHRLNSPTEIHITWISLSHNVCVLSKFKYRQVTKYLQVLCPLFPLHPLLPCYNESQAASNTHYKLQQKTKSTIISFYYIFKNALGWMSAWMLIKYLSTIMCFPPNWFFRMTRCKGGQGALIW